MGALLSEPITAMVVEEQSCESWSASSASMQGWRKTHEDAHVFECSCGGPEPAGVFVVLDGHGGKDAAEQSRDLLKDLLVPLVQSGSLDKNRVDEELRNVFIKTDSQLREKLLQEDKSGTTVAAALVSRSSSNYRIHLAHAGDSRAIVCKAGGVIIGTEDHKPSRQDETDRIRAAGGFVDHGPYGGGPLRVDGTLAVSRAFGDFHFKPNDRAPESCKVTPLPEVQTVDADPGDWILIACDGIFDVFSNEEVQDFISAEIAKNVRGSEVVQQLLKTCLDKGSKDNCTAMLIQLRHGCEVQPYHRFLCKGDYQACQNEEVLKKYREFFQAEGFKEDGSPASNSTNL